MVKANYSNMSPDMDKSNVPLGTRLVLGAMMLAVLCVGGIWISNSPYAIRAKKV